MDISKADTYLSSVWNTPEDTEYTQDVSEPIKNLKVYIQLYIYIYIFT